MALSSGNKVTYADYNTAKQAVKDLYTKIGRTSTWTSAEAAQNNITKAHHVNDLNTNIVNAEPYINTGCSGYNGGYLSTHYATHRGDHNSTHNGGYYYSLLSSHYATQNSGKYTHYQAKHNGQYIDHYSGNLSSHDGNYNAHYAGYLTSQNATNNNTDYNGNYGGFDGPRNGVYNNPVNASKYSTNKSGVYNANNAHNSGNDASWYGGYNQGRLTNNRVTHNANENASDYTHYSTQRSSNRTHYVTYKTSNYAGNKSSNYSSNNWNDGSM